VVVEGAPAPDLMIAEVQGRSPTRQQNAKTLLPIPKRQRVNGFLIEVEEIEQEKHQSIAVAAVRCILDHAEGGAAIGANAAQLPVKIGLPGRQGFDAVIVGYLRVQSRPVRVSSRIAPGSSRACIR
jgi:hypothetical protein